MIEWLFSRCPRLVVAGPIVAMVVACAANETGGAGGSRAGAPPSDSASGSGGSSAQGGAPSSGGSTQTGGQSGSGGSGGATGGAGGGADAAGTSACARNAALSGTWDGVEWSQSYAIDDKLTVHDGFWMFFTHLDKNGFLALRGDGESPQWQGLERPATAILLTPSSGPDPQVWYCALEASFKHDEIEARTRITDLGRLGTCVGGTPVEGTITVCDEGFTAGCNFTRSGTLDGAAITQADWMGMGGTSLADVSVAYPDGMIIHFVRENHFDATGALSNAFVITPDRTIYCAGPGSVHTDSANRHSVHTLTNFSRVGSCAGVTGSNELSGCLVGY